MLAADVLGGQSIIIIIIIISISVVVSAIIRSGSIRTYIILVRARTCTR